MSRQLLRQSRGKLKLEVNFAKITPMVERCLKRANNLEEWAKPEIDNVPDYGRPFIQSTEGRGADHLVRKSSFTRSPRYS